MINVPGFVKGLVRECIAVEQICIKNSKGKMMGITDLIIFLVIGAVAGWLAGQLMRGDGFGLLGNVIVGIIGAVVGGFVFGFLGITTSGLVGSIVKATAGAAMLLFIVDLVKKA